MKKHFKGFAIILVVSVMIMSVSYAAGLKETIEVMFNSVNIKVNGQLVKVNNYVYDGTTYAPIGAVAKMLGAEVNWDRDTQTENIVMKGDSVSKTTIKNSVDAYNPRILLNDIGLSENNIDATKLEMNGEKISHQLVVKDDYLNITNRNSSFGGNILELNKQYVLSIYTTTGKKHEISFKTSGLPALNSNGNTQVYLIPAMPDKGFYWPYYIVLPSDQSKYKHDNQNSKRYLFVEPVNNGNDRDMSSYTNKLTDEYNKNMTGCQNGLYYAEALWSPYIMPIFPRPDVCYQDNYGWNNFYTHAFDRDIATLHLMRKGAVLESRLKSEFERGSFDIDAFEHLDKQVCAMIDHAVDYLNRYGYGVEKQVFLYGYSAQGTFVNRFTTLHPEKVKAYGSGGTLDDMILPLDTYKGKKLIFPIGTYDYEEIVGKEFNLNAYNQVAKLIHMGKQDTNNVLPYSDCYGELERQIITELWGTEVLPRAKALIELHGECGGEGIFILDEGVEHGTSQEMREYTKEFFMGNRNSKEPVYPMPRNPAQLIYKVYE